MRSDPPRIFLTHNGSRVRLVRYAPSGRQPTHAHADSSVTLVLRGTLQERVGRHTECAAPGSVVVKPAGVEHSDSYGPHGAVTLQLVVAPRDEVRLKEAGRPIGSWRWLQTGCSAGALLHLLGAFGRLGTAERDVSSELEELFFQTIAMLDDATRSPRKSPPAWLARARDSLAECSLPIHDTARIAGVHPVHLAREFQRHYGTTPIAFRRQARIRRAVDAIAEYRQSLSDVACDAGYSDQAHLTRECRSFTGLTPLALRRLLGRDRSEVSSVQYSLQRSG